VLSGLSFTLFTAERTAGALHRFGFQPRVERRRSDLGRVLAAFATAAVLAKQQGQQLETALLNRDRIGQAGPKGIHHGALPRRRRACLRHARRLCQESNTKLTDVAQKVIDTREE
jgi:hypothetical protein